MTADRTTPEAGVCPTCGPTTTEPHPRQPVTRCGNCKEWLAAQAAPAPSPCKCGECVRPAFGPNTDGEPCDWCQDCGCASGWHAAPAPAPAERTEAQPGVAAVRQAARIFRDMAVESIPRRQVITMLDNLAAALAAAGQGTTQPAPASDDAALRERVLALADEWLALPTDAWADPPNAAARNLRAVVADTGVER